MNEIINSISKWDQWNQRTELSSIAMTESEAQDHAFSYKNNNKSLFLISIGNWISNAYKQMDLENKISLQIWQNHNEVRQFQRVWHASIINVAIVDLIKKEIRNNLWTQACQKNYRMSSYQEKISTCYDIASELIFKSTKYFINTVDHR